MIATAAEERIRRSLTQAARLAGLTVSPRQVAILARAAARAAQVPAERTRYSDPVRAQRPGVAVREQDVELLRLVARGLTHTGIAVELGVTPSAADKRVARLVRLLGVRSRVEAVVRGYELGLLGGEGR